ncbi:hypothetical protein DVH05_027242 [Phytophthora capsici]|nr:hypothetical protein DVH05_027242 [Phytophthora capsici]
MSGFRGRWRELLKEGWKSKAPTGLSNDYTYLMPGKTKRDVRGVDFFVGEAELMVYLDRIALEEMKEAAAATQPTPGSGQPEPDVPNRQTDDRPVSPNPVTTKTVCPDIQAPPAAEFSSQDESAHTPDPEPVAAANHGPVATNVSAITIPSGDAAHAAVSSSPSSIQGSAITHSPTSRATTVGNLIATSPHIADRDLGNSAGDEDVDDADENPTRSLHAEFNAAISGSEYACSEPEDSDGGSMTPREEEQPTTIQPEEVQPSASVAHGTRPMLDGPNIIAPGDNPADFATLDSDGDNENMSIYDDDEDLGFGEADAVVEDSAVAPGLHFEPSLLESVGGVGALARGSVHKDVLKDMKLNGWNGPETQTPFPYMDEPYEARTEAWLTEDYPNIYRGGSRAY